MLTGGGSAASAGRRELELVVLRDAQRRPEAGRRTSGGSPSPDGTGSVSSRHSGRRPHQVVAVGLQVGAVEDRARADQPGDRRERGGVERALLHAVVERVEQVGRRRRAPRHQLPRHVRPVHETGRDRVDGLAPAVGGEVGARDLEHARVVRLGVERGDGVGPVLRDRLVAGEVLRCRSRRSRARAGSRSPARSPAPATHQRPQRDARAPGAPRPGQRDPASAFTPDPEQHRQAERDQRHRPARAAQREPEARRLRERLEQAPERATGRRTGSRRPPPRRRPPSSTTKYARCRHRTHSGREQREHRDGEADDQQPEVLRVRDAGVGPVADAVDAVEEPVAEAAAAPRSASTTATRPAASR